MELRKQNHILGPRLDVWGWGNPQTKAFTKHPIWKLGKNDYGLKFHKGRIFPIRMRGDEKPTSTAGIERWIFRIKVPPRLADIGAHKRNLSQLQTNT